MRSFPFINWTSKILVLTVISWSTLQLAPSDALALTTQDEIGFVIAVQGRISLASATAIPRPVSLRQSIFPHDIIRTDGNGQIKILFNDNTVLSVTENTQIEITDFVYDPEKSLRRTVLHMLQGRIKAMVAQFAALNGSLFEIHTPTAVAAARGTEYVVWTSPNEGEPRTGIAVTDGTVMVTNTAKEHVAVSAGHYTLASHMGRPTPPAQSLGNREVQLHIQRSELKTDPAMVDHVKMTMNRQEQIRQHGLEAIGKSDGARLKEEGVQSKAEKSGTDAGQGKTTEGLIRGRDQGDMERKQLSNAENHEIQAKPTNIEKVQHVEKVERVGQVERLERFERPQRPERPERPERTHAR